MRPAAAPPLETERLRLRGFVPGDVEALHELWADPAVHRYITGKPVPRQDIWNKVLRSAGHWLLLGFGFWAVCERGTGRLVGEVGFGEFRRDAYPEIDGRPEIGWVLAPSHHGQGLAMEALRLVQAWGDAHIAAPETVCIISVGNTASLRVAEKLGYQRTAVIGNADDPVALCVRARETS